MRHIEALTRTDPSHNFALTLVTKQALKNKDTILLHHLIEMKTDICIVTETWLKENDDTWLECSDISRNGYKIQTHNRNIRKGRGLAIVYRSNLNVSVIEANQTRSMEYAIWKVNTGTVIINIIAIYHPPYSDINQSTNAIFFDDLADIFEKHLMSLSNIVVVGDFNLHIDKKNDPGVNLFKDMVQAFGLDCQLNFPTHQSGHTLNIILTDTIGTIKMSKCEPGVFLSDHCSVESILNIKKPKLEKKELSYRKNDDIDVEVICNELHFDQLEVLPLEDKIKQLNSKLMRVLNKLAPQKTRKFTLHPSNPWFTDGVRSQKKKMRNCERCWRKYHQPMQWEAFKAETE